MVNENRRLAIVTLHGYHNYGNKLQNYALQEVLNDLGFIADTLILSTQRTPLSAIYDNAKKNIPTVPFRVNCYGYQEVKVKNN